MYRRIQCISDTNGQFLSGHESIIEWVKGDVNTVDETFFVNALSKVVDERERVFQLQGTVHDCVKICSFLCHDAGYRSLVS